MSEESDKTKTNPEYNPVLGIIILGVVAVVVAGVTASFLLFNSPGPINPDTNYSLKVETRYPFECGDIYLEYHALQGINRFGNAVFNPETTRMLIGRADQFRVVNTTFHTPKGKDMKMTIDVCYDEGGSGGFYPQTPSRDEINVTEIST